FELWRTGSRTRASRRTHRALRRQGSGDGTGEERLRMAGTGSNGIMNAMIAEQNVYATQFSSIRERLPGSYLPWLERLRQKGMDDFLSLGFPSTKLENWKYTNVAPIRRITFEPASDDSLSLLPEVDSYPRP